jgi:mono/diheme cytochrome c family protein
MKIALRVAGVAGLIVLAMVALGLVFAYSGAYDVAATSGHSKPVEQLARILMVRSVAAHARDVTPPAGFQSGDRGWAEKAAGHYEGMCRTCHGAPGRKPDSWQLYPPPPDLADALRVTRWTDPEVFWILKHGIKDTGMSGFGASHDDDELWALTAFVRQLGAMTPEQYATMVSHAPKEDGHAHEGQGGEAAHSHGSEGEPPHQH